MTKKDPPLTEGQLVDRLRARHEGESGNARRGVLIPGVRDAAGFNATRTIDAIGVDFWPSRGMLIDAYECKSSRSDWQKELREPEKADRFCQLADRFWIVAGRSDLVRVDEVPPDWGLIVPRGNGLTEVKSARTMHPECVATVTGRPRKLPPGFDRSFMIALVRASSFVADITPEAISKANADGFKAGEDHGRAMSGRYQELYDELRQQVKAFQDELGVPLNGYSYRDQGSAEVGAALKAVLNGEHEVDRVERRLRKIIEDTEMILETARSRLAVYGMEE